MVLILILTGVDIEDENASDLVNTHLRSYGHLFFGLIDNCIFTHGMLCVILVYKRFFFR